MSLGGIRPDRGQAVRRRRSEGATQRDRTRVSARQRGTACQPKPGWTARRPLAQRAARRGVPYLILMRGTEKLAARGGDPVRRLVHRLVDPTARARCSSLSVREGSRIESRARESDDLRHQHHCARGLHGDEHHRSDDSGMPAAHSGRVGSSTARTAEMAAAGRPWHFVRNALDYLPRKADDDCRQELRWLYDRRTLKEAEQDLQAWLMRMGDAAIPSSPIGSKHTSARRRTSTACRVNTTRI